MRPWQIQQLRGGVSEGVHAVHAVAVDRSGQLLWQIGEDLTTTFRSAAKPFQLETSLSVLPRDLRNTLTSADLALGSGSHHGEALHIDALGQLLSKLGLTYDALLCGPHEPYAAGSARALYARGELPSRLHNNCSGKHAFFAAACAAQGYARDYLPVTHPLQQGILACVRAHAQLRDIPTVVDGCGAPCFVLPLSAMARAYAALANAVADANGSELAQVGEALRQHPILMSGHQGFDGWLIRTTQVIAKIGAQGLLCIALPQLRAGIAIKIESGVDAARPVAALALLSRYVPGLLSEPLPEHFSVLHNTLGVAIGEFVCVG